MKFPPELVNQPSKTTAPVAVPVYVSCASQCTVAEVSISKPTLLDVFNVPTMVIVAPAGTVIEPPTPPVMS
jgi:hypothetical protein